MDILFGILATIGVGVLIALQVKNMRKPLAETIPKEEFERLRAELQQKTEEMGALKRQIETLDREKEKIAENGKQLFVQKSAVETDVKMIRAERDQLLAEVKRHEAHKKGLEDQLEQKLQELSKSNDAFQKERERLIKEDEEQRKHQEEERDRMWNDHELSVISLMSDLCKQPQFAFTSFTNNELPEGFDGSLKPDFMIEFLGQYVIFDAKVSKAKSLQSYITDQVKRTAEKVKDNESIHRWIFLVVPAKTLEELHSHHYPVNGFHIFVVSPEALPAILASFKHITRYEFAEQMDPQQRENIVQLIAELDFHINLRNAADITLSRMGTQLLEKAQKLDPELAEEVALKKAPMNAKAQLSASDIKKLVTRFTEQNIAINDMVSPKAAVNDGALKKAEELLEDAL